MTTSSLEEVQIVDKSLNMFPTRSWMCRFYIVVESLPSSLLRWEADIVVLKVISCSQHEKQMWAEKMCSWFYWTPCLCLCPCVGAAAAGSTYCRVSPKHWLIRLQTASKRVWPMTGGNWVLKGQRKCKGEATHPTLSSAGDGCSPSLDWKMSS